MKRASLSFALALAALVLGSLSVSAQHTVQDVKDHIASIRRCSLDSRTTDDLTQQVRAFARAHSWQKLGISRSRFAWLARTCYAVQAKRHVASWRASKDSFDQKVDASLFLLYARKSGTHLVKFGVKKKEIAFAHASKQYFADLAEKHRRNPKYQERKRMWITMAIDVLMPMFMKRVALPRRLTNSMPMPVANGGPGKVQQPVRVPNTPTPHSRIIN